MGYRPNKMLLACFTLAVSTQVVADLTIERKCFFPEGITSTQNGDVYVGSMQHGSIVKFSKNQSKSTPFIKDNANNMLATLGLYADEKRNRLLACSSNPAIAHNQVGDNRFAGSEVGGIRIYDLQNGKALGAVDFPGGGFCNDLTVDEKGNIYATDTFHGRVIKYDGKNATVWAMGGILADRNWSLNGLDFSEEQQAIFTVHQQTGQLFRIDLKDDGSAAVPIEIALSRNLVGPDGLKVIGKNKIGVLEAEKGSYSLIELNATKGTVSEVSKGIVSGATFTIVGEKVLIVEGQGSEFWSPKGSCNNVKSPFNIKEISQI